MTGWGQGPRRLPGPPFPHILRETLTTGPNVAYGARSLILVSAILCISF
ncbi:unnamed protein product [Oppiella nova]|uniref:Uncharacterized protein n=1 Tax=Oppiella nova TaxID=334625 RepID=A0A7R9QYC1_9ACAR|nr:unnamed protein product [Oppiella nova]CAG2178628.1 unnamed protein product [Oppiella nova]